jgi:ABC-type spermidine/putrescine transport system permease subunit I
VNPDEFNWQPIFYKWLVATFVMALIGAVISVRMGYPAYLLGGVSMVLTGMTGLFVLASKISGRNG